MATTVCWQPPSQRANEKREFVFTAADFEQVRKLIHEYAGISLSSAKQDMVYSRLARRLREKGMKSFSDYLALLKKGDRIEWENFVNSLTTNLTSFFREPHHFPILAAHLKKLQGKSSIKIWCCASSTGEEPYTIAMLLNEKMPLGWNFEIVASDLSLKCLMTAKEGFYAADRIVGIPDNYLAKYFDKVGNGYKTKNIIQSRIRFDYHNLLNTSPWNNFDVVFCRNVLIYFDEAVQTQVISRFWNAMTHKSFLYIGHSESLFGLNTKFEFVKTQWTTLYKKWVG